MDASACVQAAAQQMTCQGADQPSITIVAVASEIRATATLSHMLPAISLPRFTNNVEEQMPGCLLDSYRLAAHEHSLRILQRVYHRVSLHCLGMRCTMTHALGIDNLPTAR